MKKRIKQITLTIAMGILFLTCTNPFFPGTVDNTPNNNTPHPANRTPEPNTYIVTFHVGSNVVLADDDSNVNSIVVFHLSEGAKIPKLPALKRTDGYGFGGWYTNEACTTGNEWNFDTAIMSNIDLYARWVPPPVINVQFITDFGTPQPGDQILASGALVVEPPPVTKDGYAFDGWYTETAFTHKWNFAADTVTANMILYAKWHPIVYIVKFETDGGSPIPAEQNVAYDGKVFMPQAITKEGYGFGGWYKDSDCTSGNEWNFATAVTGNITLYAKWDPDLYTVEFDPNFGDMPLAVAYIANGAKIYEQVPIEINPGYGFGGWFKDSDCTPGNEWNFASDKVTGYTVLYAKWDPVRYIVEFDANGGDTAPPEQYIANGNTVVMPQAITRTGYGFAGWYKEAACTNEWIFASDTVTGDITLYAKWVPSRFYTVTFNTNSSLITAPVTQIIIEGGKITEPLGSAMRQDGYSFRGWYTEDQSLWDFVTGTVSGNMTLHAEWSIIYYTVIFDMTPRGNDPDTSLPSGVRIYGGGDQQPETQTIAYGGYIEEPNGMTINNMALGNGNGYGFDGWYIANDKPWVFKGAGTTGQMGIYHPVLTDSDTIMSTTTITMYPRWRKDETFTGGGITVWARNGSFMMGNQSVSGSRPVHEVTVTGFYISSYLVTREQYIEIMGYDPSTNKVDPKLPVTGVTWYDALTFCNKLSVKEGLTPYYNIESTIKSTLSDNINNIINANVSTNTAADGYRLPTEAEWEYAARGGNGSPGNYEWAGSNTASEVAWFSGTGGNSGGKTQIVGLKKPNILRTYDMSGNACEWCWDWFDSGYYSEPAATNGYNPTGPASGTNRVRRGGSWNHGSANTRTFIRDSYDPAALNVWTIGFRVVRGPLQ
jgi:uncharacterized repeat protein (TIGR02543 family)